MAKDLFEFMDGKVAQSHLVEFSEDSVNLKREHAQQYRTQVNNLRDNLERYIREHPEIGLAKMLLSGSLAKGTALRTIHDVDVALYVNASTAPSPDDLDGLLEWLVARLRKTYPQIAPDKIKIDGPCVVISFAGTGIDVDVAPIHYKDNPEGKGYLWDRETRRRILTSIPQHLDFIRRRKEKQPTHFAQVVRLLKWWANQRRNDTQGFVLRSFLIELLVAKLADDGIPFADYHSGLEQFFLYLQKSQLRTRIAFTDYYRSSELPAKAVGPVEVFDPVTPLNNVADDMTEAQRRQLVDLAAAALDALAYARSSQTKSEAIQCWQELMGPSFRA